MLYRTRIAAHQQSGHLYGLTKAGIEIASRMPLAAPINADNRRWQRVPDTGLII
jgi:hypothetical protein